MQLTSCCGGVPKRVQEARTPLVRTPRNKPPATAFNRLLILGRHATLTWLKQHMLLQGVVPPMHVPHWKARRGVLFEGSGAWQTALWAQPPQT